MGQINHTHEKFAAAPRCNYCARSFLIVMGTCATIHGQYWMKKVIVDMTIMLKMLIMMALQRNNKDEFVYVILIDLLIYKLIIKCILKRVLFLFLTGLYDLLRCYKKILKSQAIILSLTTAYWCYQSSHMPKNIHFQVSVLL